MKRSVRSQYLIAFFVLFGAHDSCAKTKVLPSTNNFTQAKMPSEAPVSDDKPVMLTADEVEYFQTEDKVIARGHVEVVQGATILLCDQLSYDRPNNTIRASGNVSVMEEAGNVVFAEEIELKDDLKTGVAHQFMARLTDDSLFAATRASKKDEFVTELEEVVYSPCRIHCDDAGKPEGDPLWQIRADKVKIDEKEQTVTYQDAQMEFYGLPLVYTPYLSHATPDADNKSGVMIPEFSHNDNLGNVYKLPVYYAIAPDKDATITPIYTSREDWVMVGNYRQKFDQGNMVVDASGTHPRERDASGALAEGRQFRGHVFTEGDFAVDPDTSWGFNIRRTTDDTYLRRYDFASDTQLTSRIYSDNYGVFSSSRRNFIGVEALAFQGLTAQDDSQRIPMILPMVQMNYESDPGTYNDRFFIESNAMVLTRDIGAQTQRLSNLIGWRLPVITPGGQVIEFTSQLRGDVYNVTDVTRDDGSLYDGVTGRLVPEASVMWRYPFIKSMESSSLLIEPVVNLAVSPNGGNPDEIPNEDSLLPEFTDTNLFDSNRFSGYDRIETGTRVSYGLRGVLNHDKTYFDWLFGQHYRVKPDQNFPFSNDVADHLSDYVGKVGLQYSPFDLAYRFRLDKERFSVRRSELDAVYTGKRAQMGVTYLSLKNDPVFASREELYGYTRFNISKHWIVGLNTRRDLLIDQMTSMGGELTFNNECISISNMISREYTRDRDVRPSTNFLFQLSFKNLN